MSRWSLVIGLAAAALIGYSAWTTMRSATGVETRNAYANPRDYPSTLLGLQAPGFRLLGSESEPIGLEHYKGQTVLLSFWSSF